MSAGKSGLLSNLWTSPWIITQWLSKPKITSVLSLWSVMWNAPGLYYVVFPKFGWYKIWSLKVEYILVMSSLECFSVHGHLCGQVVRVSGYRSRDSRFDSRRYLILCELVGLEQGPLSLVNMTEELLEWKNSGSRSRKLRLTAVGIHCADHVTPSIRKSWL
jgi:hypothetical protein